MTRIFQALFRSVLDLFHPRMLLLLFVPPLLSLAVWIGLGYAFWDSFLGFSQSFTEKYFFSQQAPTWMTDWVSLSPDSVATALTVGIAFLLLVPLVILSSMLITSVVAMPAVLAYMGKYFPGLEKRGSGVLIGSVGNLVKASVIYLGLWLVTLPLWVIPGLAVALPLLLNGFLNYRLFAYDSLGDYASPRELKLLLNRRRVDFLLLGVLLSALVLIPPFFLILPVYSSLCFARFSLLELQEFRKRA